MNSARANTRSQHYHGGAKAKLTGNKVQPAPAWRARNLPVESSDPGSKILFSNLPIDVTEEEIIDLMRKTIGPVSLKDSFLVYNSKGVPRGMAVVSFVRGIDAPRARNRYNGKLIDGKRAVKIEVILDQDVDSDRSLPPPIPTGPRALQKPKTLFDRIAHPTPPSAARKPNGLPPKRQPSLLERTHSTAPSASAKRPPIKPSAPSSLPTPTPTPITPRRRHKKGPKRVKKKGAPVAGQQQIKTAADLDREMEEYIAGRPNGDSSMIL